MQIFRIRLNSNLFQSFLPAQPELWQTDVFKFDCQPKISTWKQPDIYIQNPKREPGDFYHLCSGAFVADESATEKLRDILEMAGELLPLQHSGTPFYLVNVLQCANCLDERLAKWVLGKTTGAKIRIAEYFFDRSRLPESTLFKIPETSLGEVLCVSGIKDPEDEFKAQVEKMNLKGIIFEKLWSDE